MKRVVVIAASILFFRTAASYLNIIGTVLALTGVFAYSMAERMAKSRPDLKASMSPSFDLQAWMLRLVPRTIRSYWEKRDEEARWAAEAAAVAEARRMEEQAQAAREEQEKLPPPEYFL